jgi:hypothetical protein
MSLPTLVATPDPEPRPAVTVTASTTTTSPHGASRTTTLTIERAATARPAYVQHVLDSTSAPNNTRDALARAVDDLHAEQHDRFSIDTCTHPLCRAASVHLGTSFD